MGKKKKVIVKRRGRPGINWKAMKICGPIPYPGTAKGAKANAWRANQLYAPQQYKSFTKGRGIFVERTK